MASKNRIMAAGMQATNAGHLGQDLVATIVPAGTSNTDATAVTSNVTLIATTASNTGIILKNAGASAAMVVYNGGANTLKIYPASGEKINNQTASTGTLSVPTTKAAILIGTEGNWVGIVSA